MKFAGLHYPTVIKEQAWTVRGTESAVSRVIGQSRANLQREQSRLRHRSPKPVSREFASWHFHA